VTAPRFGRRRQPDAPPAVFSDGRDITEVLGRPADWDGTTIAWEGASDVGLPDGGGGYDATGWGAPPHPPAPAARTGPLERLRTRTPAPEMLPAPPPAPDGPRSIARGMARGWPHLFEVRCQFPAAASATPIPCGAVHRDEAAGSFRALRASAYAAGWHLDALGRMACPRCCQASPEYRTLYPVTVHSMLAAEAYVTGDLNGERGYRAAAEHGLFRDVLDTARRGRHAGGAR
jgi:hypothetical protein